MGIFDSGGSFDIDELFFTPKVAKKVAKDIFKGKKGKQARADLADFLSTALELTGFETGAFDFLRGIQGLGPDFISQLQGLGAPAQELVDTGFRTDIQPVIDAELRRFSRETIPGVAERFGSALSGSGFQQATAAAAADLGIELGALQTALDEAAAGRRITGLQLAPGIFGAPTAAGLTFGNQFLDVGGRERGLLEAQRPGARLAEGLGFLTGIETRQGFQQTGGTGQPSDFASIVSALGAIASPATTVATGGLGIV